MEQNNPVSQPWQSGQVAPPRAPLLPPMFPAGRKELWFAGLIFLCGMAMANFVLYGGLNLGFAVALVACICVSVGYLVASGRKLRAYPGALLALSVVIAAGFVRSNDGFVKFMMVCFLLLAVNLGLCLLSGQARWDAAGVCSLLEAPRVFFGFSLWKMPESVRGLVTAFKNSGSVGKKTSAVLLGLVIAVPLLIVVIFLLISADAAFAGLVEKLPSFDFPQLVGTVLLGTGAACLFYARAVALLHTKKENASAARRKGMSKLTVNTVLMAVCAVYLVYMLSQLAYFVGGFAGILPEGYTMAAYARRGFFEMGWLCAINLLTIALAVGMVEKTGKAPLLTRILCLFLGVVTLFFVVAASAKMGMYIGSYGLTRLRVLTEVIMVFLGLATATVCIWLFVPKLPYMKVVLLLALIMGAAVIWADVDTVVASYNVRAYQSGQLEMVDVEYLTTLSAGAVPYIAELADAGDRTAKEFMQEYAVEDYWDGNAHDLRSWNWTDWLAGMVMKR